MNITTKTYDIPVTIKGAPENVEEVDKLIGKAGACFELAIDHLVAHVILGKIRDGLADAVVAAGFPKDTKTVGDKNVEIKPDKNWFAKAFETLGWDMAQRMTTVQAVADSVGFDVSSSRGLSGGPTQEDLKNAQNLVDAILAGRSTFERVKGNLENRNPGLDIEVEDDGTISVNSLATALGYERRRIAAEVKAAQSSGLL